ncbi:MAG: Tol biopolymer transport system component [Roseivirga sp.]|jgi:Tol biopolymer transport system component
MANFQTMKLQGTKRLLNRFETIILTSLLFAMIIALSSCGSGQKSTNYVDQALVYISDRDGFNLYQIDQLGQWEKQLTFEVGQEYNPKWNEGLQSIVYYSLSDDGDFRLKVLNSAEMDSLAFFGLNEVQLFPDAKSILFTVKEEGGNGIWMSNLGGGGMQELVSSKSNNGHISISPNGETIAFISDRTGSSELFKLDLKTLILSQLTENTLVEKYSSWSPDGRKIAFSMRENDDSAKEDIYIINSNGSDLQQLTRTPYAEQELAWSLDGKKIAFHATSIADGDQIYTINLEDGHFVKITSESFYHGAPTWVKVKP